MFVVVSAQFYWPSTGYRYRDMLSFFEFLSGYDTHAVIQKFPNTRDYMRWVRSWFMNQNVGTTDRQLRTLFGALAGVGSVAVLAGAVSVSEIAAPVLGVIALVLLGTALTGTCGLYSLLGVDTCPMKSDT